MISCSQSGSVSTYSEKVDGMKGDSVGYRSLKGRIVRCEAFRSKSTGMAVGGSVGTHVPEYCYPSAGVPV